MSAYKLIGILVVIVVASLYWNHRENETLHKQALDNVRALADLDTASIDIPRATSACTNYLATYPNRKERMDVDRWLSAIQQEQIRRDEMARLAEAERKRIAEEQERLKEAERIANLPENLYSRAMELILQSDKEAIPLLEKSANQGFADASYELAKIYAKGLCGIEANENSMVSWLATAQKQGHVEATSILLRRNQQTKRLDYVTENCCHGTSDPRRNRAINELATALQQNPLASSESKKRAVTKRNRLIEAVNENWRDQKQKLAKEEAYYNASHERELTSPMSDYEYLMKEKRRRESERLKANAWNLGRADLLFSAGQKVGEILGYEVRKVSSEPPQWMLIEQVRYIRPQPSPYKKSLAGSFESQAKANEEKKKRMAKMAENNRYANYLATEAGKGMVATGGGKSYVVQTVDYEIRYEQASQKWLLIQVTKTERAN